MNNVSNKDLLLNEKQNGLEFYVYTTQSICGEMLHLNQSNYKFPANSLYEEYIEILLGQMEPWVKWYSYKFEFLTGSVMGIEDVMFIIRFSIVKSVFKFDFDKKVKFKTFVQKVAYNDVMTVARKCKSESFFFLDNCESKNFLDFKQRLDLQMAIRQKNIDDLVVKHETIRFFNAMYKSLSLEEKLIIAVKIDNDVRVDDYCKSTGISRSKYQRQVKKVIDKLRSKINLYKRISQDENTLVPDWVKEVFEKDYSFIDDDLNFEFMSYEDVLIQMDKI